MKKIMYKFTGLKCESTQAEHLKKLLVFSLQTSGKLNSLHHIIIQYHPWHQQHSNHHFMNRVMFHCCCEEALCVLLPTLVQGTGCCCRPVNSVILYWRWRVLLARIAPRLSPLDFKHTTGSVRWKTESTTDNTHKTHRSSESFDSVS